MTRTIIKTETSGWYLDPDTGKKTRKQDGDVVVTQEEFDHRQNGADANIEKTVQDAVASEEERVVIADTGKILRGKTTTIKCQHKVKVDNKTRNCGAERVVKVQDAKQVKRCVPHQEEHRRRIHKEKAKAKRAAERAAAKS